MVENSLLLRLTERAQQSDRDERREAPRAVPPPHTSLDMRFADGRTMCVTVLNVSARGLELECGEQMHAGDRVHLRLSDAAAGPYEPFEIVRVRPHGGGMFLAGAVCVA